jgi:hypothetical protein
MQWRELRRDFRIVVGAAHHLDFGHSRCWRRWSLAC